MKQKQHKKQKANHPKQQQPATETPKRSKRGNQKGVEFAEIPRLETLLKDWDTEEGKKPAGK